MAPDGSSVGGGGLRLVAQVGNEHFEPGLARLELDEGGQCLVLQRFAGKEDRREGRIEPDRATALIRRAQADDVAQARERGAGRARIPDEPRYRLAVYRGDDRLEVIEVWRSDLPRAPGASALVEDLQDLVRRVSDGQVIF